MSKAAMNALRAAETLDLHRLLPDPEAVQLVPRAMAVRFGLAPIAREAGILRLAMRDPSDLEAIDYVEMVTHLNVQPIPASEDQVRELIQRFYGSAAGASELDAVVAEATRLSNEKADGTELPIVRLVDQILAEALRLRATDVHMQPEDGSYVVRFRIDGELHTIHTLPKEVQLPVTTRIKVMADLDISERRLPQDGKIDLSVGDRRVDLRVSTLPTVHGENTVLRVLDHSRTHSGFEQLGFSEDDIQRMRRMFQKPNGILLVTGPTGSGKTTTLYAALGTLDRDRLNILTLEDPVEYRMAGVRQAQIHEKAGFTFAGGLRAAMRQDPDVILVGEIRDQETAEIAVRAALTGHLVLSTLHTNSAVGSIARLRDMGIENFLLASTLTGVIAQRLVRRLCAACAEDRDATDAERLFLGVQTPLRLKGPRGCPACGGVGYAGRFVVYELLEMTSELSRAVGRDADPAEMQDLAEFHQLTPIRRNGAARVLCGWTTVDELARVVA